MISGDSKCYSGEIFRASPPFSRPQLGLQHQLKTPTSIGRTMASTGKTVTKNKKRQIISSSQLVGYLNTAKNSFINSKQGHSSTLQETSVCRSLFSGNTRPNLPNPVNVGFCKYKRNDEEMALGRWALLLGKIGESIARKELRSGNGLNKQNGGHQYASTEKAAEETRFLETSFHTENEVHQSVGIRHIEGDEEVNLENPPTMGKDGENLNNEITPIGDDESRTRKAETNVQKKVKGRSGNKRKVLDKSVFVDVNEELVPISDSQRQMSSLIGSLARDPRKLPLDCFDWRKMEEAKKDLIWIEVKRSYNFLEGREPRDWVIMKAHASWRDYKSELKEQYFNGNTLATVLEKRPEHIPLTMWTNLVEFWSSDKGKAKGNKIDKLGTWLLTHEPKKGSKLDDASAMKKELIVKELACLKDVEVGAPARDEIFEKIVGEVKYGYAQTFGMGVKLPRSHSKRCALKEEKAKRLKIEQEHEETKERLQILEDVVSLLLKNQGLTANHSKVHDLTIDDNAITEKNQDEDRYNEDDEAESDEVEDVDNEEEC